MIIFDGLIGLLDFILLPIQSVLTYYSLDLEVISLGFGTVIWFEFSVVDLVTLVVILVVLFIFIRFIYWMFKTIFNIVVSWLRW